MLDAEPIPGRMQRWCCEHIVRFNPTECPPNEPDRNNYERFIALWRDVDPAAEPMMSEARRELASLER